MAKVNEEKTLITETPIPHWQLNLGQLNLEREGRKQFRENCWYVARMAGNALGGVTTLWAGWNAPSSVLMLAVTLGAFVGTVGAIIGLVDE